MKNLLIALLYVLCIACGGNKNIAQNTPKTNTVQNTTSDKKTDTIIAQQKDNTQKIIAPIEEKAPEIEEQIISQPKAPVTKKPKTVLTPLNHQSWNTLLVKHVAKDGTVNYKGFKQDRTALRSYLKALEQNIPAQTATKAQKLAYWMNVYNAFTIKLIIDNYPIKSIKDIKDPWDLRFFKLGKKWYTLNDIEHRILRKMKDPRIHFGINCASFSCPPLLNKAFTAQNVDKELEKLTISFINDTKRNTITPKKIEISKIFSWFGKDFKKEGTLIDFLNKYSKISINNTAKKNFKAYDWTLNE